jgi:hypothetical protein
MLAPVAQTNIPSVIVFKGDELSYAEGSSTIERINRAVGWSDEDREILPILAQQPANCYFAKNDSQITGYAIVRTEGSERHLHVSWIATDTPIRGVGTELMRTIVAENRRLEHKILTLSHHKDDPIQTKFYKKFATLEGLTYEAIDADPTFYYIVYRM